MATISLCMIVRDEEQTLARCLDSICGLVDEIILVDTGSVDRTVEIAGKYTEKIFYFPWIDDFSAARNFSSRQLLGLKHWTRHGSPRRASHSVRRSSRECSAGT